MQLYSCLKGRTLLPFVFELEVAKKVLPFRQIFYLSCFRRPMACGYENLAFQAFNTGDAVLSVLK